jgi:hypothetical protein
MPPLRCIRRIQAQLYVLHACWKGICQWAHSGDRETNAGNRYPRVIFASPVSQPLSFLPIFDNLR